MAFFDFLFWQQALLVILLILTICCIISTFVVSSSTDAEPFMVTAIVFIIAWFGLYVISLEYLERRQRFESLESHYNIEIDNLDSDTKEITWYRLSPQDGIRELCKAKYYFDEIEKEHRIEAGTINCEESEIKQPASIEELNK